MPKFRKKPVVVEAVQWDGNNFEEIQEFIGDKASHNNEDNSFSIETLEGIIIARVGDWIIKGIQGEFYPCKKDIFKQTYEEVK